MSAYAQKVEFVNFYLLHFLLVYNSEISTGPTIAQSNSHLTGFLNMLYLLTTKYALGKRHQATPTRKYANKLYRIVKCILP